VFDAAINSGVGRASKWIQEIAGVTADGAIGNTSVAAIVQINPVIAVNEFCDKRQGFLESLKTFPTFGKGWTKRVTEVRNKSLEMVG
jgi:lysozyme family protein